MQKISAHYIIPVSRPPIKQGIIVVDDHGKIHDIIENHNQKEYAKVEFYNGVIIPGLINAHCHLELSMLKDQITKSAGMTSFLSEVVNKRQLFSKKEIEDAIKKGDAEMKRNGIVAVADIVNSKDSGEIKTKSKIRYHNFIELFGLEEKENDKKIKMADALKHVFKNHISITPHSFYSVNKKLFEHIFVCAAENNWPVTIHNQESKEELLLFTKKEGPLYHFLSKENDNQLFLKSDFKDIFNELSGFSELKSPVLLVHNTYSTKEDIEIFREKIKNIYWVFCPQSNLFIENKLPDINLFRYQQQVMVLGTDSLASNSNLNILEEIKTIMGHYKNIPFVEILEWATLNGARALSIDHLYGSIEIGKQPGLNLINQFDFINFAPSKESTIKVLV